MGQISIRLSDKQEIEIRNQAKANKQTLAGYIKERLSSSEPQEQPLSRVTIEYEIDKLKNEISMMNDNILFLSKELLRQSKLNSELSNAFILLALKGAENKQLEIYESADRKAEKYVEDMFEV